MSVPLLVVVIIVPVIVLVLAFIALYYIHKIFPNLSKKKLKEHKPCIVEFHNEGNETPYLIKRNPDGSISDEDFRVVSCADLHLATEEHVFGLTVLERLVDKVHPDLLVLLGDNACGRLDTYIEEQLIKFFERKKLHYAFVLGNHDSEPLITTEMRKHKEVNKDLYDSIQKKYRTFKFKALMNSKYCVGCLGEPNLFGAGNYSVNIKNSSGVIKTLYFFDSGDYIFGVERKDPGTERRCYDHIHDDQLEWYKKEVKKNNADSIAFFHIPLFEYIKAARLSLLPFYSFNKSFGNNYEKPSTSDMPDNTFKVFKECGSTKVVVVGHDHKDDSCIKYKGIKLMFSQGLQYDGAYNRRKHNPKIFSRLYKLGFKCYVEGVSVFDLSKDKIDITPVYAEKEKVYYGLEKYYKRAWLEDTNFKNEL